MTFVGCYGEEQKLTDCAYHEFESISTLTTSNDVSISWGAVASSAQRTNSEATASLSISVILTLAVIALVVALIILLIMQRRNKR